MPASARLLQKLKESWGDELTQDLVSWVNEAQTVNRAELRELADLYFARAGDRLEARIALSEARFGAMLDERLAASEAKFGAKLDDRIAASEAKRTAASEATLEAKLGARLDERINGVQLEIARLGGRLDAGLAGLRAEVASQMRDQMKWMFVFWAGTMVPLAGLIVALGKAWL